MFKRLLLFLICCVVAQLSFAQDEPSINLALGEWPPFISKDLPGFGSISEVVVSAFKNQGFDVDVGFFPWKRSYELTRLGHWDATAVWLRNPKREASFYYSDPVMVADNVFFYRKDSDFDWSSLADLKGYVIGGSTGYYHGSIIEEGAKTGVFTIERIPDEAVNFRKLLLGRVDLVVANRDVGNFIMDKILVLSDRDKIAHHKKPVNTDTYHLIVGKKNQRAKLLLDAFNRGLNNVLPASAVGIIK